MYCLRGPQLSLLLATIALEGMVTDGAALSEARIASPTEDVASSESPLGLPTFPKLQGLSCENEGFMSIDTDGVYRAYLADGTVTDASRLSPQQIQIFLSACEPWESTTEMQELRTIYTDVDSSRIPDEQLLNPSDSARPWDKIAAFADAVATTPRRRCNAED
ncbi:hypothetical protein LTR78_004511 [Recurvomyces mirabilis]|uniref:Uncharacterized protein n=1 Tax=Recurvomyces mirabilis TaxID=574656 RepID=A0AAE1C2F8_9PEZI|nr:hypothetical protein LTR78_004511 [Recurvomyces mirabilis]KAK5152996.1 hypothetical protein LTS14_008104 [Recurvomyces mirabilis]